MFDKIESNVSFPKLEEKVLEFWDKNKIFKKQVETKSKKDEFIFYDGPPFATGLPHYGHFVPGTIKDVVPRYWAMNGKRVERRFGWDCHGLPVENEMKKTLGISSRKEIEEYGVENYNERCRSIVLRYTNEWRGQITRMGRWVDFDNDYKTMDPTYMESIWWVFKTLWEKGLIYEGYNILPYSPGLCCPLSNFELNQGGYKEVTDQAVTVRFKVDNEERTYFLAWTTTPWTLPSNEALAFGKDINYVLVEDKATRDRYYLAQSKLDSYFKSKDEYKIIGNFKGSDFKGKTYEPLFPYYKSFKKQGAFICILGDFVTETDGCGIVHIAPGFGEDDYKALLPYNLPIALPIDEECCFTEEVLEYKGLFVKDADKLIIDRLKEEKKLIKRENYLHKYPFCYRTGSPIIYRALSCWFVDVPKIKETIIKTNKEINWVPEHLKEGRFGKWLEGAREWAISRNRFWGNPIPVWKSESGKFIEVIGSIKELEEKCGKKVLDIHKHFVDKLTWKAPDGTLMKRIPDVLDCWFESGSMPYAQVHYPFEHKNEFEKSFPADFINEGLDQTRGWFYTLHVIAAGLFGKPAFKNCVTSGIVLNAEGKKMSKSLRNFTNPMEIVDKFGADALRFALMHSPVVRAEDLKFSDDDVKNVVKDLILPLWSSYTFLVTYARIDNWRPDKKTWDFSPKNELDKWMLSRVNTFVKSISSKIESYKIDEAADCAALFIDDINNWYIRRSRRRFWKSENDSDKKEAYNTLYRTIMTYIKAICPFIPFVTEAIYQNLKNDDDPESIHLCSYPKYDKKLDYLSLETKVKMIQDLLRIGRALRSSAKIRTRQPLSSVAIVTRNKDMIKAFKKNSDLIKEELNVKKIEFSQKEENLVVYSAKADYKVLGKKLGSDMKAFAKKIEELTSGEIAKLLSGGSKKITIDGKSYKFTSSDIVVTRDSKEGLKTYTEGEITIGFDVNLTPQLVMEGKARDLIRAVQMLRKELNFEVDNRIKLSFVKDGELEEILSKFWDKMIAPETLSTSYSFENNKSKLKEVKIEDFTFYIGAQKDK